VLAFCHNPLMERQWLDHQWAGNMAIPTQLRADSMNVMNRLNNQRLQFPNERLCIYWTDVHGNESLLSWLFSHDEMLLFDRLTLLDQVFQKLYTSVKRLESRCPLTSLPISSTYLAP
jgi:hypothetical protein